MVSLSLMARLVEAVRPEARLVLVGDPGQLTSIEAGAVLGDIVGPPATPPRERGIVVLDRVHRFGGGDRRARRGDPRAATPTRCSPRSRAAPERRAPGSPVDVADAGARARSRRSATARSPPPARSSTRRAPATRAAALEALGALPGAVRPPPRPVRRGDVDGADRGLARRRGRRLRRRRAAGTRPAAARDRERLRAAALQRRHRRGRRDRGRARRRAAFERRGEVVEFSPARLGAVETVYAMTIHKSQGSQFGTAAVLLPDADLADPHPRAALHGGHARARPPDPRRHRGRRPRGGRAAGRARLRAARRLWDD